MEHRKWKTNFMIHEKMQEIPKKELIIVTIHYTYWNQSTDASVSWGHCFFLWNAITIDHSLEQTIEKKSGLQSKCIISMQCER